MDRIFIFNPETWHQFARFFMEVERDCYHENLRETVQDKKALLSRKGCVTLLYEADGVSVAECYGTPIDNQKRLPKTQRVHDIENYQHFGEGNSFYAYATSVLPSHQGRGIATSLKRAFIAHARVKGFRYLVGHAKEGAMVNINEKFGARIVRSYDDWYNTGNTHYLYELDVREVGVIKPVKQEKPHFCGPACLKATTEYFGGPVLSQESLAEIAGTTSERGTSPQQILNAARELGYRAAWLTMAGFEELRVAIENGGAVIVSWFSTNAPHWSVVDSLSESKICLLDPEKGEYKIFSDDEFRRIWFSFTPDSLERKSDVRIRGAVILQRAN